MSFSGQSNPPWQRNSLNNILQGQIVGGGGAASVGYQGGAQMFLQQQSLNFDQLQSGNIFQGSSNSISYPQSRSGLNPVAFQNSPSSGHLQQQSQNRSQQQQHYNSIGTVTKINSECGLVNDEVLFYRNVCKGHIPKLGDRVLFEASYSQNGQYKWNATRVQMMPQPGVNSSQPPPLMGSSSKGSGYNAVPPPNEYQRQQQQQQQRRGVSPLRRGSPGRDRHARSERDRERTHRSRERDDDEQDRKRRREDRSRTSNPVSRSDRERDRDREDSRRETDQSRERRDRDKDRERSPVHRTGTKTRRTRTIRRYMVQIPKTLLTFKSADIQELRQRYSTLYIPSDFFHANIKWSDSFTHDNPFSLRRPCQFHIMHKIVEPLNEISNDLTEPEDANYKFSAKVMLMSCPPIAELYQKCFEDDENENEQHTVHPSRLISFLVGTRGRNEPMAIGGAWSPSLDGENPDKDPSVLIRTAIRTCKSLTGIDLSNCTQWYRFVELYYHRTDHKNKDKEVSPQVETVVIYLPDIHSCIPTISEWENLTQGYKDAVENVISRKQLETSKSSSGVDATGTTTLANEAAAAAAPADTADDNEAAKEDINTSEPDITIVTEDSKEDEEDDSPQPTHYSQLDLKTMKVQDIRNELIARNLPSKGVRNLIMARLAKALNTEKAEDLNNSKNRPETDVEIIDCDSEEGVKAQNENGESTELKNNVDDKEEEHDEHEDWENVDMNDIVILDEYDSSKNPEEGSSKEFDEREKLQLKRRYTLPNAPHVIVHPSKTAKGGKFDCSIMSLSVLLDYRPEDTKERFFEVSLFAELFNEMLMRDFGFNIYKELYLQKEFNLAELESTADDATTTTNNNKKDETKSNDGEEKANGAVENKQDNTNTEKKKDRRVSKQSADVDPEDDNQSIKSSADRKRKATNPSASDKKMIVVKPQLLLSFVYFDTSHCGYIFEKDLEDLFSILGLSLSRGQIRKVLGKSASRQAFYYRKLTDKEESAEGLPAVEESDEIALEDFRKISLGNKQYFPVFKTESNQEDNITTAVAATQENNDLISYNGALIHVGKLMEQIKRTENNFSDLEKIYNDLRKQNNDLQKEHSKSSSKMKDLQSEVKNLNRKLSDTDQGLYAINRKYKDQHSTLSYIYHRVSPYFNREKDHKSENSRDKDHDKHKEKDNDKSKDNKEKDKSHVKEDEKERKNNNSEKKNEDEKDKDKPELENDVEMKEKEEEKQDNNVTEVENEKGD